MDSSALQVLVAWFGCQMVLLGLHATALFMFSSYHQWSSYGAQLALQRFASRSRRYYHLPSVIRDCPGRFRKAFLTCGGERSTTAFHRSMLLGIASLCSLMMLVWSASHLLEIDNTIVIRDLVHDASKLHTIFFKEHRNIDSLWWLSQRHCLRSAAWICCFPCNCFMGLPLVLSCLKKSDLQPYVNKVTRRL